MVNRTLISAQTNKLISKSCPAKYLDEIIPGDREAAILSSHYIESDALAAMYGNDFDAFLKARETALIAEINQRICG